MHPFEFHSWPCHMALSNQAVVVPKKNQGVSFSCPLLHQMMADSKAVGKIDLHSIQHNF